MKDEKGNEYESRVYKIIYMCYGPNHDNSGQTAVDENGCCLFCSSKNVAKYVRVALVSDATTQNIKDPDCPN